VLAKIWLAEHEPGADARAALATSAVEAGQWCLRRAPDRAACDYALALALGVQAREKRTTAKDGLKLMVEHLRRAAAADPALDEAGPDRILAILLVRAPGWPLGPGDPEEGLAAARRAVDRFPGYPPNRLALADALAATGAVAAARAEAAKAVALARTGAAAADPDAPEWIRDGERLTGAGSGAGAASARDAK
jgi:hypothetical protein